MFEFLFLLTLILLFLGTREDNKRRKQGRSGRPRAGTELGRYED